MKKRFLCLIIVITLLLSGCSAQSGTEDKQILGAYGAQEKNEQQQSTVTADITLLYYPDMDTNPVTTTCLANNQLLKLVYQPLVRQNPYFRPECVLARDFTQNGDTLSINIRTDAKFSDGTDLTAQDVVATYNAVKKNKNSPYYSAAAQISKCYAQGTKTVVFKFKEQFADAAGLVDFPIMKGGKTGIGCGPYKFSALNGKQVLAANENYFERALLPVLRLVETKSDSYVSTMFSAGELDILSLPGSDDLSLTSLRNYSTLSYPSNNLVYIGVNTNSGLLSDATARYAISAVIDRNKIAGQTLVGLALPTIYPFNPTYYKMLAYNIDPIAQKPTDYTFKEGAKLELLIASGSNTKLAIAECIAENLKSLGITVKIKAVDMKEYTDRIKSGDFDLYLGESAIPRSMDPTFLYASDGALNYGGYSDATLDSAYSNLKKTGDGFDRYLKTFLDRMPIIPIVFRKNVMYTGDSLTGFCAQTAWDSYGNFHKVKTN